MSLIDPNCLPLAVKEQEPASAPAKCVRENEPFVHLAAASADVPAEHPLAAYGPMKITARSAQEQDPVPWLWEGYLVRGGTTQVTSLWKSGKTTLLSVLLDRMRQGGTVAARPVHKARVVVLSEESPAFWRLRAGKLNFGDSNTFLCRPFRGKPRRKEWIALIDRLVVLQQTEGLDLLVIDPLAAFLPGRDENSAATMLELLAPLQRLTSLGVAVLLFHHPRKHGGPAGTISRGSGALMAVVDIYLEMEYFDRNDDTDRRRRLRAFSRLVQTPRRLVLELNQDGTDYVCLGDFADVERRDGWHRVRRFLESAPCKLTREEILEDWPSDDPPVPGATALWQWLEKAVAEGLLSREGAGAKNDPFVYWLPGKEIEWPDDPLWFLKHEDPPLDVQQVQKIEKERIRQQRRQWKKSEAAGSP